MIRPACLALVLLLCGGAVRATESPVVLALDVEYLQSTIPL